MTEPNVLRLARDEHLKLSVNLVNYAYGLCGPVVPRSQAKTMEVESPDGQGFTSIEGIMLSKDEVRRMLTAAEERRDQIRALFDHGKTLKEIKAALNDVPLKGAAARFPTFVETTYQELTAEKVPTPSKSR